MSHGSRRMRTIISCKGQDCSLQDARSMAQDMLAVCASLPQHQQTNLHKVIDSLDDLISIQQDIVPASRTDQQIGGTQSYLQMDEQLPAGWGSTDDPAASIASPQEPLPPFEPHIQGEPMPVAANHQAVKKERKKDKQQKEQPGETSPVQHSTATAQPSSKRKKKREREEAQQDGDSKPSIEAGDLTENGQLPHAQEQKQSTGEEHQADEVKSSKKAKKSKSDGSVVKEVPENMDNKENKTRKKKKKEAADNQH